MTDLSARQSTSGLETEVLLILLMCPESSEELATMFVAEDEERLRLLGGSLRAGVDQILHRLKDRDLVADHLDAGEHVWQLTRRGGAVARRLAARAE